MNIALAMRFQGMDNAGLGRISSELIKGMESRGHNVNQMYLEKKGLGAYLKYSLCDMAQLSFINKNADVFHAISPVECLWMPPEKTVVTICDMIPLVAPDKAGAGQNKSPVHRQLVKQYFKFCCGVAAKKRMIVTISDHTKEHIMHYLKVPESRVKVVRLGIRDDLQPQPKPDSVFRIGYLGQLDHRKRVHLLIDAFKQSKIDGELVIGGTGVDELKLKKLANGDQRIKFLGFVPDSDLCKFYNSLDLFVFPSAAEGYGLPIVEAWACKKPVVVLDDAIIPAEIKDKCPRVIDLNNLFERKELLEMTVDYHNRWCYDFAKKHSWKNTIQQYERIYTEVANG